MDAAKEEWMSCFETKCLSALLAAQFIHLAVDMYAKAFTFPLICSQSVCTRRNSAAGKLRQGLGILWRSVALS